MALEIGLRWVVFDRPSSSVRSGLGFVRSLHSARRDAELARGSAHERACLYLDGDRVVPALGVPVWFDLDREELLLLADVRQAVAIAAARLDEALDGLGEGT